MIAIIGAASSIGIRPYDDEKEARHLDRAPAVLRELGIVERLGAEDVGDLTAAPYKDFSRPPGCAGCGRFPLVLGGDCSIVLGTLLGASRTATRVGLAYVDAHADFATPQESRTGSAASMCLGLATGRGDSVLARLNGSTPLVRAEDVALLGRRDEGQTYYGHEALAASRMLDMPWSIISNRPLSDTIAATLARLERAELDGFWVHVDADVLDPQVMPAVDSPEPGGPGIDELVALVAPLARHPRALGMQITIYDPALDRDRSCAARLVSFLEAVLADRSEGGL
jgi:arginase